MARSGGVYSLPLPEVQTGTTIEASWANTTLADVATALTNSIAKDGQTTPTADLPMSGQKHTGVGNASARNQYPSVAQIQDGAVITIGSIAGTDTITGSLSPAITAFATGMRFQFIPANDNTGAATIAVNGLAAKAITKYGATALAAGDLLDGYPATIVYDGTQFVLLNPRTITLDGGDHEAATLNITGTTATDLSDNGNPLNIGTESGAHLALDPNGVQAKSNATTATTLELNNLGGAVNVGPQSGSGAVTLYNGGTARFETTSSGVEVNGSSVVMDAGGSNADLDFTTNGGDFRIRTQVADGRVAMQQFSAAGSFENHWIQMHRDGSVDLYYDGAKTAGTTSGGFEVRPPSGGDVAFELVDASGSAIAQIRRVEASNRFQIWHRVNSEPLRLYGTSSGGAATILFDGDPDGAATAYHAGSAKLATSSTGATVTGTLNATTAVQVGGDDVLVGSNNLSDVSSASTSRSNLGIGSMATRDVTISTSDPSGSPANGTIWIKHEA